MIHHVRPATSNRLILGLQTNTVSSHVLVLAAISNPKVSTQKWRAKLGDAPVIDEGGSIWHSHMHDHIPAV